MTRNESRHHVTGSPLQALASPPPVFDQDEVSALFLEKYGLQAELRPLVSERDQNFHAVSSDGSQFVIKIANSAEPKVITDFQIQALLHVEKAGSRAAVPRIVRALDGSVAIEINDSGAAHVCRVVTYLPGIPVDRVKPSARLAENLGMSLAQLDIALSGFEHAGDHQVLLWDMQRAADLRPLLDYILERELRERVAACLLDFETRVSPELGSLRSQVIHNDVNGGNVLAGDDGETIRGIIDFGDMLRAPLIIDVAIAAAYLRIGSGDPLRLIMPFVAGYHSVTPLENAELELLFDLVRTRLAATIAILRWRLATRGESDAYSLASAESERSAEHFLAALDVTTRNDFSLRVRQACGLAGDRN